MTSENEWQPLQEAGLIDILNSSWESMSWPQRRLWQVVSVPPQRWSEPTFGGPGGGFWVVAILGTRVIYFNDIEDGFNLSPYALHGEISEYRCNQDELEVVISRLLREIATGESGYLIAGPPEPIS